LQRPAKSGPFACTFDYFDFYGICLWRGNAIAAAEFAAKAQNLL
jgi:hypothetical protein